MVFHNISICHNFSNIVSLVPQFYFTFYHRMSMTSHFSLFFTSYHKDSIYLLLSKLYGTLIHFVSQFAQLTAFSMFKYTRLELVSSPKSRQKWANQSVPVCIYYLGFILLLCYGDLHCFHSFIISNWLAICSG